MKKKAATKGKNLWKSGAETTSFQRLAIVFLVICIVVGIFGVTYYEQLQQTIRSESTAYLREIATRISGNINKTIDDTYAMLYSVSSVLQIQNPLTFESFRSVAQEHQAYWGYQSLLLIDFDGNAYDVYGAASTLNGGDYLREVILQKKASMSPAQILKDKEETIFAVPLNQVQVDGVHMSALAVAYDVTNFNRVLSLSSFNDRAYSHLVGKDGTIVVRSDSTVAADIGYNVLRTIENDPSNAKVDIALIKQNMRDGVTGQIDFKLNGEQMYMVYCPVVSSAWYLYTFVPMEVVNARSNMLLLLTIVISGIITIAFATLIAIMIRSFYSYKHGLEKIAYVDPVTHGNTANRFYELAEQALEEPRHPPYAMIYTNLEKFKVLNENFGRRACDEILRCVYDAVNSTLSGKECMGRSFADNFCVLIEYKSEEELFHRFEKWYGNANSYNMLNSSAWAIPVAEFGVYVIENDAMSLPQMIDRAKLALRETAHTVNSRLRFAVYTDEVRRRLFREKHLEDMMENALKEREFQIYLQPKYFVANERIAGAEVLCRWISKTEGMIYPDEFIPLFEKNGFIIRLDLWVFEETCHLLRNWIDAGRTPIKISVNCSRVHLKNSDFLKTYSKIAEMYHISKELIEIELTESIVLENSDGFQNIIEDIHNAGLSCSMDDFGSGYSSLNLIQDLAVDTLKIDKIFFRDTTRDPMRTESVLANIIGMAKALAMETVAEGVEHYDQVEMLRRIGCDMIQGYVFAKPMPVADFELLMNKEEKSAL